MLFSDPSEDGSPTPLPGALAARFGLPPAQARLFSMIGDGETLADYAARTGILQMAETEGFEYVYAF